MNRKFFRFLESRKVDRIESLAGLRARAGEIRAALRAARSVSNAPGSLDEVPRALAACREAIEAILAQTKAALEKLGTERDAATDTFRLMQVSNGAFRSPKVPDRLNTLLLAMAFWLLEGGMAGAILISEGRMDVPAGLVYGLIFALVNIILGLLIGYLPLRYLAYRSPVDLTASDSGAEQDRSARLIRRLSAFGLGAGLAMEAVLIFGAARLRALGTHTGVFDFSETGFWATFNDSLAIIIAVIGTCSVVLAVLKGYSGLDDPIPGFAECHRQATADMDEAADSIADQADEAIEEACDTALGHAEDALADAQAATEDKAARIEDVARAIDRFNDNVRTAQEAAKARAQDNRRLASFVTGRKQAAPVQSGPDAYDALILPCIDQATEGLVTHSIAMSPIETEMAKLNANRARCLAEIQAALTAFRASAPTLNVLFDEGDDDDQV